MSTPRADERIGRVAVLGAGTSCGTLVREALAEARVDGSRVALFGATEGDALLSEYDGEARLIQEPDPDVVASRDVVFICEAGPSAAAILERRGAGLLVVDLVGAAGPAAPLVHPSINPEAANEHHGVLRVPHPLASLLAEILHPVERLAGVRKAMAVVLRPASDRGERGLEELRDQTIGLLRFGEPPKEVFGGRQLAFNVIAEHLLLETEDPALEGRVRSEVRSLLGWPQERLAVSFVTVPVFHGHAASVRVETEREVGEAELRAATAASARAGKGRAPVADPTPIDAAGHRRTTVSHVAADGIGGFWLWAVGGEAGPATAARAIELAELAGRI